MSKSGQDADKGSGEDRLIARLFKPLARDPAALGLTDDVAVLTPPAGHDIVLTTDAIVSGVHFLPDDPADLVARKAMRVNLSDLAAKGARPLGFLLSLALPANVKDEWLEAFARGLGEDIAAFGCALFGGDTDRTPGPLGVTIAMTGIVPNGTLVKRAGAKPGDIVFVTGAIGDAALGLQLAAGRAAWPVSAAHRADLVSRYRLPQPPLALAPALRAHASAAMDISDGLAGDLAKLCRVSGIAAEVQAAKVPLSDAARAVITDDLSAIEIVLAGGDDYEILCTVPPGKVAGFTAAANDSGVPITQIGTISAGEGVRILDPKGAPMQFSRASYSHF